MRTPIRHDAFRPILVLLLAPVWMIGLTRRADVPSYLVARFGVARFGVARFGVAR